MREVTWIPDRPALGVHENFIWSPHVIALEFELKELWGKARIYARAVKDLYGSVRIARFKPFKPKLASAEERAYAKVITAHNAQMYISADRKPRFEAYLVQLSPKGIELLGTRVKTYPWKVLSDHGDGCVTVERVSETGSKYKCTYHKSFLERMEIAAS